MSDFIYSDLATIMGSPVVDGMAMPASYGDQVRENLMALWNRETFCVAGDGTITGNLRVNFTTTIWATPNCQLVTTPINGVRFPKGAWILGASVALSGSSVYFGFIDNAGFPNFLAAETVQTSTITIGYYNSTDLNVLELLGDGTGTLAATGTPILWGVQLSDP